MFVFNSEKGDKENHEKITADLTENFNSCCSDIVSSFIIKVEKDNKQTDSQVGERVVVQVLYKCILRILLIPKRKPVDKVDIFNFENILDCIEVDGSEYMTVKYANLKKFVTAIGFILSST